MSHRPWSEHAAARRLSLEERRRAQPWQLRLEHRRAGLTQPEQQLDGRREGDEEDAKDGQGAAPSGEGMPCLERTGEGQEADGLRAEAAARQLQQSIESGEEGDR